MNMNTSSSQRNKLRPAPADALVVIFLLICAALIFRAYLPSSDVENMVCVISQSGEELDRVELRGTGWERVYGDYTVSCDGRSVAVTHAPCSNQDCVRTGHVSRAGQSIVCLPGRFTVQLTAADGSTENSDFDLVLR